MAGDFQYDEKHNLIKIKIGFKVNIIPVENIQTYSLSFGNKTYNKSNLGKALVGGAVFGLAGIILAGTHTEEYVSNIKIMIKANDKFYFLIMTIGKVKVNAVRNILNEAEKIIRLLDEITTKRNPG